MQKYYLERMLLTYIYSPYKQFIVVSGLPTRKDLQQSCFLRFFITKMVDSLYIESIYVYSRKWINSLRTYLLNSYNVSIQTKLFENQQPVNNVIFHVKEVKSTNLNIFKDSFFLQFAGPLVRSSQSVSSLPSYFFSLITTLLVMLLG